MAFRGQKPPQPQQQKQQQKTAASSRKSCSRQVVVQVEDDDDGSPTFTESLADFDDLGGDNVDFPLANLQTAAMFGE